MLDILETKVIVFESEINKDGDIMVDGQKVINLHNNSIYAGLINGIKNREKLLHDISPIKSVTSATVLDELDCLNKQKKEFETISSRLSETFSKINLSNEHLSLAKDLFVQGQFRKIDEILQINDLLATQMNLLRKHKKSKCKRSRESTCEIEQQLDDNAIQFIIKAQLAILNFEDEERLKHSMYYFANALRSRWSRNYIFEYVVFLQTYHQYDVLSYLYLDIVDRHNRHAEVRVDNYEKIIGVTLKNLGDNCFDKKLYREAVSAYEEAVEFFKYLAKKNTDHFEEVLSLINQISEMIEKLIEVNLFKCNVDIAPLTYKLGNAYQNLNMDQQAAYFYEKLLTYYRRLAGDMSQQHEVDIAKTTNNLGNIYKKLKTYEKAAYSYKESLRLYRKMALSDASKYEHCVARTLKKLGNIYRHLKQYEDASATLGQSLLLYRKLAEDNPNKYKRIIAGILDLLNFIWVQSNNYDKALDCIYESISITRELAKSSFHTFSIKLCRRLFLALFALHAKANYTGEKDYLKLGKPFLKEIDELLPQCSDRSKKDELQGLLAQYRPFFE